METLNPRGEVHVKIFDRAGNLIEETREKNLFLNAGRTALTKLIGEGAANKKVASIGFGTSGTVPTPVDTALVGAFVKPINGVSYPDAFTFEVAWSIETDEGNGLVIREMGLYSVDGTLIARRVREAVNKTDDIRLEGTWKITL
jgi:hypothetical protein